MNWLRAPSAGDGFRFALSEKQLKEMELNSTSLASCAAVRRPAVSVKADHCEQRMLPLSYKCRLSGLSLSSLRMTLLFVCQVLGV